jgi:allantoinase
MSDFDLIIRGAQPHAFVAIADGKFAMVADEGSGTAQEEIDASGLEILPGVIDAHVHFNEPGRADWEGLETGSKACAAGGTTTFFDMPLNAHPPTVNAAAFDEKLALATAKSVVDFALWGGLVPGNLDDLEPLRDQGVIGFKAFMSNSGIEDFSNVDFATLRAGMKRAAALGLPVAVHAEVDHPELKQGSTVRDYLNSRPISMELEAIRAALEMAGETGCALHIVHVSSAEGLALISEALANDVDVTCETCPHYFTLTDEDVERIGALAKCAPPIRSAAERDALLEKIRAGEVDTLGSDHSPSPMAMKQDADFYKVWGGIAGCQHLLALAMHAGLSEFECSMLLAENVATRFTIGGQKGRILPGLDADCVLVNRHETTLVEPEALYYQHRVTPYAGMHLRGRVERTILRGVTVALAGCVVAEPGQGRLIKPIL